MAKGNKTDLADELEKLIESEAYEPTGGLIDQFLYKAVFNRAKAKDNAIKALAKQINTQGTEQEKQKVHAQIVRRLKEQALNKLTEKEKKELEELNQRIRNNEKQIEEWEREQKQNNEIFKLSEQKLKIQIANAKKEGQATDKLEQELKNLQDKHKKDSENLNKDILNHKKVLQSNKSETDRIYSPIQQQLKQQFRDYGLDMSRVSAKDYTLNEQGSSEDIQHALEIAKLNYESGEASGFATKPSGLGGRLDIGADEPTITTKPQKSQQAKIERQPSPQELASLYSTDLGDLGSGIVSAVPDKMQQNLNQNARDEEIAHRTERESLTDQYREQVLDNLNKQTYQLTTIQENLHAIYNNMGQMGEGGSGGGLMDMLSGLFGGAIASKGMGLVKGGLGLAKGALTKIPLIGGIVGAGFGAFDGATDTESIMRLKGYTDPSQISWLDRIQSAGAGGLAGAGNGALGFIPNLLGFDFKSGDVLEGVDRWANILSGKGNKTDAELKAIQESQTNIDANEAEMNALLASRGIIQTADGSYQIKDNSIHGQILEKMGIENAKVEQGQELAELNEGMGGVMNSSVSNVTNNNTTNVIPESPRFRINDTATMALSAQGL